MAHYTRREGPSTLPFEATESAATPPGQTARVKNASASHKAPSRPAHASQGGRRRRSSKDQSASHAVSSSQTKSSMSESQSDKKRNKLNYTRISIACAHCRRRKMRCEMDESVSRERCLKCIQFGKDCVFYPVDQAHAATANRPPPSSSATQQSSSVSSSPTDLASEDQPYGAYVSIAPHASGSQSGALQGYSTTAAISDPTIDPTRTTHHSIKVDDSPWQYPIGPQQNYRTLPQNQYPNPYSPQFISPASAGDFSPYPVYSPTHGHALYNQPMSPYTTQTPLIGHQMAVSHPEQQWAGMPSSSAAYAQGYLQPSALSQLTTTGPGSAFADPTYYSGTSDSTQAADAEAWYSSYGSEEQYDTPPDAKPYGGRSHWD